MEFDDLVAFTLSNGNHTELVQAIEKLLVEKKAGKEKEKQPRDAVIDTFIHQRLSDYQQADFGKSKPTNYELADTTFRTILQQLTP